MINSINYNGQILPEGSPIFQAENRAFRYGDGLFETIRFFEGKMLFLHRHWERLQKGMDFLGIEGPEGWGPKYFQLQCLRILPDSGNYRLRFTIWRSGAGQYGPQNNQSEYLITCSPLDSEPYPFNETGLTIGLYTEVPICPNPLSLHKTINALPYVLAAKYRQEKVWDDCLLLNLDQRLVEASSSNLFIIKGKKLFTPPLSEGCIAGVMRSVILDIAAHVDLSPEEVPLEEKDVLSADELFLTNSIQGIRWVSNFKNSTFDWAFCQLLSEYLNFFVR